MKSYVDQLVGKPYATYPAAMDDLLSRAEVNGRVFTGIGNKSIALDWAPEATHCAMTGLNLDGSSLPGDFEVTASYDTANKQLVVSADEKVRWSVLVLAQKGAA